MKNIGRMLVLFVVVTAFFACAASTAQTTSQKVDSATTSAPPPMDAKKHTEAGKYVNALQAYEMWKADPDTVRIVDCRTQEEYTFVGHASMAYNIPSKLWTGKWNPEKKSYILEDNPDFESYAKKKIWLERSDSGDVPFRSSKRGIHQPFGHGRFHECL
ncbi:hypothetical protein [Desulfosarcina cetonica]|uniref:hypothetical protein n=1 Tax=Desulfosarcina cetonica TaxID=90730 RepID=UPI0012ED7F6B|nr:hypothetical protein [Desulfosarcina cetonica]